MRARSLAGALYRTRSRIKLWWLMHEAKTIQHVAAGSSVAQNAERELVRHTLATLAYRAAKSVRGAPSEFGSLRIGPTTRTPAEILAQMGDLMDWALTMAQDRTQWRDQLAGMWTDDVDRLFASIAVLDQYLASQVSIEREVLLRLVQGPIADALTHTGQLNLLRRLANAPVRGESYQRARIAAGQTGFEQPPPEREFD